MHVKFRTLAWQSNALSPVYVVDAIAVNRKERR